MEAEKEKSKRPCSSKQLTLQGTIERRMLYPSNSARRMAVDNALVEMICVDMQPVSIVEDSGFTKLLHQLDPRYQIPSRRTLMRDILPKKYEDKMAIIQGILNEAPYVSVTTDIWSSIQSIGYMTITAHCLTPNWELKSLVLQTRALSEAHTAANIAGVLKQCANERQIEDKLVGICTDNAANATAAVSICGWRHIPCLAHTLNLVVQAALSGGHSGQPGPHAAVIKRIKDIVSYFHRSIKASDELRKVQAQLSLPEYKLMQECETRWNSTFFMLERYLVLHTAVTTTLCLLNQNVMCIMGEELGVISEMIDALKPYELATRELSSDKYTSVSKVIPLVHQLQSLCSTQVDNNTLSRLLSIQLSRRFTGIENSYVLAVSCFCDPRFKKLPFKDPKALEQAEKRLIAEMTSIHDNTSADNTSSSSNTAEISSNPLWITHDNQVTQATTTSRQSVVSQMDCSLEVKMYCRELNLPRKDDPLLWWMTNQAKYPLVSKVAFKYLGIPATSVPSERLFSKAGELVSKRRNRLKPNVDLLLFLNQDS